MRNIRAYQDRGLLPSPQRRGRQGIYTDAHQARLRMISRLLERGYTLANIGELIASWEHGDTLTQLLGLEAAVTGTWNDEPADYMNRDELTRIIGVALSGDTLQRAIELDLIRPEGTRFRIPSPRLVHAIARLVHAGMSLEDTLAVVATLRYNVEQAADAMTRLIAPQLVEDGAASHRPPTAATPELSTIMGRLHPTVENIVLSELARAMAHACEQRPGHQQARATHSPEENE